MRERGFPKSLKQRRGFSVAGKIMGIEILVVYGRASPAFWTEPHEAKLKLEDFFISRKGQPDSYVLRCHTEGKSASRPEGSWLSGIREIVVATGMG